MVETKGQKKIEHAALVPVASDPGNNNSLWIDSADSYKLKFRNNAGSSAEIGAGGGGASTSAIAYTALNGNTSVTAFSIPAIDVLEFAHAEVTTAFDAGTIFEKVTVSGTYGGLSANTSLSTGLVAYWSANVSGSFPDATGNGHDGTITGATFVPNGKSGGAYDFNGTSNYVTVPDSSAFSFTSGGGVDTAFSISAWIKRDVLTGAPMIFTKWDTNPQGEYYFFIDSASNGVRLNIWTASGGTDNLVRRSDGPGNILDTVGRWYHVVCTYDASKVVGGIKLYLDGSEVTTYVDQSSGTYTGMTNTATDVLIGALQPSAPNLFVDGLLDEIGVWSKELTASEVSLLYNSSNSLPYFYGTEGTIAGHPSLNSDLAAVWEADQESAFPDSSGGGHTGTVSGATYVRNGVLAGAYSFDGVNDDISVPDSTDWDFTGTVSVNLWMKSTSTSHQAMMAHFNVPAAFDGWELRVNEGAANKIGLYDGTASRISASAYPELSSGEWVMVTYVKTSGTNVDIYLDGIFKESLTMSSTNINGNQALIIGRDSNTVPVRRFNGFLTGIIIWNKALTSTEVLDLYNNSKGLSYDSTVLIPPGNMESLGINNKLYTAGSQLPSISGATNVNIIGNWSGLTQGELTIRYLINDHT